MAAGDMWKCGIMYQQVNIHSSPVPAAPVVGYIFKGDVVIEESRSADGLWIKHNRGGYTKLELLTEATESDLEVKTYNENSEPPSNSDEGAITGYLPPVDVIFESNDSIATNSEFANIKHVAGVFGLPYQFLPNTDPRIISSSQANSVSNIGYEYAERIIEHIPLLFLAPGKANFMAKYSKKDKESILEKMIGFGTGNLSSALLDELVDSDGRYYTFEYTPKEYYKFVNPMCRIAARFMNIQDLELNGTKLDRLNWESFTQSGIKSIGDFGNFTSIPFYVDTESSISESFGNSTTQSMIASTVGQFSDMAREFSFLLGSAGSMTNIDALMNDADIATNINNVQDVIQKLLGSGNFMSNLASHLGTVASGGKLMFPEIWSDSQLSRSYNVSIKLISPDTSNLSVYLNVIVPLLHLLGLVAPQSIKLNPNGYANPFLVRAIYKGFFNIDTGIITDMSVSKGAECQWTPEGIPTSINVSLSIKDLYNVMGITKTDSTHDWKFDTLNNTALMDYIANLCGINIFKPEVTRMIEMWYINNFANRVTDFFQVNVWSGIQQKVQNLIMNIYR